MLIVDLVKPYSSMSKVETSTSVWLLPSELRFFLGNRKPPTLVYSTAADTKGSLDIFSLAWATNQRGLDFFQLEGPRGTEWGWYQQLCLSLGNYREHLLDDNANPSLSQDRDLIRGTYSEYAVVPVKLKCLRQEDIKLGHTQETCTNFLKWRSQSYS